ncbi:MAG: bifunctional phosphoribosylaminoimidazolecarboxamide formyltransferase/IMP cyclohydrolase, partial [Phycisphaerales bacterium]|nr:bifunctional phosphoribosylaminoimidazolecarboxamide formyltransferase/IMP cyclohydrolase [Phycisphaerales bacterium]
MSDLVRVRRALLSVSDKTDLVPFARGLSGLGVEIVSTGGTAAALTAAGIPVQPVEAVTGFPEMMDGRLKTLHPAVHGALLGRRDNADHVAAMNAHGIVPIDLVCVNLYPFERTVAKGDVSFDQAIEQIDIGGPSMVRSAAKNNDFVAVVTDPRQYDRVMGEMLGHEGATTLALRRELAAAAFRRTAEYDLAISAWMGGRADQGFPETLRLTYLLDQELRYGENPHQRAALYREPVIQGATIAGARVLHGKKLSYNNINDAAAALDLGRDLFDLLDGGPSAAIVKHTNPCGAARGNSMRDAFERAYAGDPLAAYGGILVLGGVADADTARAICEGERFFEVVVAERFEADAADALGQRWKNVRLLECGSLRGGARARVLRSIPGGLLLQDPDDALAQPRNWQHVAGPKPDQATTESAAILWTVCKHLKSNAVCIGRDGQLLGAGAGQMDRVAACRIAIEKAGPRLADQGGVPVAASDAFFPFPDGPQLLVEAGVRCIVHPGGSKRDEETVALCREHNVTCLLTGVRHFRH